LRDVIRAHGLQAQKSLGQNFLLDQNLTDKIVRLSGDIQNLNIIEIGPGPGGLTRSILKGEPRSLSAIEYDPRAIEALESLKAAARGKLEIMAQDALLFDIGNIPAPRAIIANLPYNISTVLLFKWLEQVFKDSESLSFMSLMFQKEVADRILAEPDNKIYGRLSVMVQWLMDVKRLFDVPPSAFVPAPKVTSTVLYFKPKKHLGPKPDFEKMEKILASAFGQRRKMIRSSLKDYLPSIEKLGLNPTKRAEQLSVEEYIQLALSQE
jgi:16S rRNA (adenine1518-N6/adenine1519-N6)-dimethyltransferase